MTLYKRILIYLSPLVFCLAADCGNPPTTPPSPFLNAMGIVGVSSPSAQASGVFATGVVSRTMLPSLPWESGRLFSRANLQSSSNSITPLPTVQSTLNATLTQSDANKCLTGAFSFPTPTPSLSTCYGPAIFYENHPDGADGPLCAGIAPCYLPGALGIWSASETTGEACATSQGNAMVQLAALVTNAALNAIAGILCISADLNFDVPQVGGAPLDLSAAINETVSGAKFTAASIGQIVPRTGALSTWQTQILGTISGETIEINLTHSPTNLANTTFDGHLFGLIGDGVNNFAFSLTYQQTVTALMLDSKFGLPTAVTSDPFDVNNDVDFNHALLAGQPVFYTLEKVSPLTGVGTAYIAWMDSNADPYARSIQMTTTAGLSADSGLAYIGFANPLTSGTNPGQISKMICNWGGPAADYVGLVGQAEEQHFVRNSSGMFVADQSAITFAPTNSCAYAPGTLVLSVAPAAPAVVGAITPVLETFNGTTGVGALGNIPVLSEPSY